MRPGEEDRRGRWWAGTGLANAVVSVAGAKGAKAAAKAVLDQKGCKFVPHVVVMAPGEIEIKNSDDILHNIHTYSTANPPINKAQPKFKKTMTEKFEKPEYQGPVRRPQLDARLGLGDRGPAAVTDGNGVTKIENVPAGKQKVEVGTRRSASRRRKSRSRPGRTPR